MNARESLVVAAALALSACSEPRPAIVDCTPAADARPVCGFQNPEDLALLPNGEQIVISQMGEMDGSKPGSLVFFEPATDEITPAFAGSTTAGAPAPGWGDPTCPGAPDAKFSPHGLALARRPDAALQLLVVNHGGRESIEFFEVGDSAGAPSLTWRGCALPPAGSFLNDVASLPDGGFVTTHMFPRDAGTLTLLKGLVGLSTGWVYEWQPATGFTQIAGSEGPMPNGIEASPDGETLYVNLYFGDEVRKLSRKTGETLASLEIASPDNVLWSPDGSLLVASHNAPLNEMLACGEIEHGSCPFHYSIVELDPDTLAPRALYENVGPPMGAGTAALRIGDELFIGSFRSDRIVRVPLLPAK